MALLVILPATAGEGSDTVGTGDNLLTIDVVASGAITETQANLTAAPPDAEDTRLGRTTYVSNQPDRVAVRDADTMTTPGSGLERQPANTVVVTIGAVDQDNRDSYVKLRSSSGDRLTLVNYVDRNATGGVDAARTVDYFQVIEPGAAVPMWDHDNDPATPLEPVQVLEALDGDTITITAGEGVLTLVVDGAPPVFSDVTPAGGRLQDSSSTTIGFTVTDEGSGLRTEAEDSTTDPTDTDRDGSTAEPLTKDANGAATDIDVFWEEPDKSTEADHEERGSRRWEQVTKDRSYELSYGLARLTSGTYKWYIEAYDRVGNWSRTDSDGSKGGSQDFELDVDNKSPVVSARFAGIGFDPDANKGKGGEVKDPSSILVVFVNESDTAGEPTSDPDSLDNSTIGIDDFVVVGNEVVDVIHPNKRPSANKQKVVTQTTYTVKAKDGYDGTKLTPDVDMAEDVMGDLVALEIYDSTAAADTDPVFGDPEMEYTLKPGDVLHNWPRPSVAAKDDTCDSNTGYSMSNGRTIEPNAGNKWDGSECVDTRNRVYLVLSTPLVSDDEPEVQVRGGAIRDRAGNGSRSSEETADDRIAPNLAVTVSGDVATEGRPLAQDDITVAISSSERLRGFPKVWLAEFSHGGDPEIIGTPTPGSVERVTATSWTVEFGGNDETEVYAIIVWAEDIDTNVYRSAGWKGDNAEAEDGLDLAKIEKAGLLVEFDNNIPFVAADVTLNPHADDDDLKTESPHPFIRFKFNEGKENTKEVSAAVPADSSATPPTEAKAAVTSNSYTNTKTRVETKFDSYGRVELTQATLDGNDVTDNIARVSSAEFDLALANLSVGVHSVEFTITDTAGNSRTEDVDFEVIPRGAYKVALRPGWNLVSFPGDPVDTAIDSALPADHPATEVIKYEAGIWIAAVRETGQPWEGELTDIDGQSAYWINTGSTAPLSAVLVQPGVGSASRPPAISLIAGWNLIPVTDLDQERQGAKDEEGTRLDVHDNYFSSLDTEDFVVAYTYDAVTRRWERVVQAAEGNNEVSNGQGVWVYSRSNVVLVP